MTRESMRRHDSSKTKVTRRRMRRARVRYNAWRRAERTRGQSGNKLFSALSLKGQKSWGRKREYISHDPSAEFNLEQTAADTWECVATLIRASGDDPDAILASVGSALTQWKLHPASADDCDGLADVLDTVDCCSRECWQRIKRGDV